MEPGASPPYAELVEGAPDAMLVTSPSGHVLYANPALLRLVGYSPEQACTAHLLDFVDPKDLAERPLNVERVQAGETVYNQRPLLHRDGHTVWVETATRRLPSGVLQMWLRDISERRRLEDELRQAQKIEAVGLLAAGLAHDLNNLLTVILGHAELLRTHHADEDSGHTIQEAAMRAAELTRQLLAFGRRQHITPRALDLSEVVERALPLVRSIAGENVRVVVEASRPLPLVEADVSQIEQALMNLVTNAIQAMAGAGTLTIRTQLEELSAGDLQKLSKPRKDPWFVVLSVTDTGPGMEAEVASRAFDPFFTTKSLGTGLGLSVVHGVVGQHGGLVRVHTGKGRGCTLELCIPRSLTLQGEPSTRAASVRPAPGAGRILLAEDEAAVRRWLTQLLERAGYEVVAAADGSEALTLAKAMPHPPYCILSDVRMPRMSGPELLAELRTIWPSVRAVLMTGYAPEGTLGLVPADVQILLKPFSSTALLETLSSQADRRATP